MTEQWKDIRDYPNYKVSSYGRVFSKRATKLLATNKSHNGYTRVCLDLNGKTKTLRVSRIVALHFVDGYKEGLQVHHVDENKDNNCANNLQWVTHQYNSEFSVSKTYRLRDPDGNIVEIFNMDKFCRENDLNSTSMASVFNHKQKQYKMWTAADRPPIIRRRVLSPTPKSSNKGRFWIFGTSEEVRAGKRGRL